MITASVKMTTEVGTDGETTCLAWISLDTWSCDYI